jgi:hypothetical protein
MLEKKAKEAAELSGSRDAQASEITMPYRIVCTRQQRTWQETGDREGRLVEIKVPQPFGRSLLEPRG